MSVSSYPFHFLPLKLSNKKMSFPFLWLKLSNKGREEYSKIILFIPFYSISFPPPKRGLSHKQYQPLNKGTDGSVLGNLKRKVEYCAIESVTMISNFLFFWEIFVYQISPKKFWGINLIVWKQTLVWI